MTETKRQHLCELDRERSAILVPRGSGLNHNCEPNATRSGVKVFAWRVIRVGEEINHRLPLCSI